MLALLDTVLLDAALDAACLQLGAFTHTATAALFVHTQS